MSLVTEALRKARAEQQRRQVQQGLELPPWQPRPGRKSSLPLWAMILVSLLSAAISAALAVWWVASRLAPAAPAPTPAATQPAASPHAQPTFLPQAVATPALLEARPTAPPIRPPEAERSPVPSPAASSPPELVLSGVADGVRLQLDYLVYGAGRSFARINGQEVRQGDSVAGFVVERIEEEQVVLRGPSGLVVLKLR